MKKHLSKIKLFLIKKWFYLKMRLSDESYSENKSINYFDYTVSELSSEIINKNTGFDIKYQYNKLHNLNVASRTIDGLIILPGETFSLLLTMRNADKKIKYKDGLIVINGKMAFGYGGGLCQISNVLHHLFLMSPLDIVERHPHTEEYFKPKDDNQVVGIDATIAEGFLDLKVKNNTKHAFQIQMKVQGEKLVAKIFSEIQPYNFYKIINKNKEIVNVDGDKYLNVDVYKQIYDKDNKFVSEKLMYKNSSLIKYLEG